MTTDAKSVYKKYDGRRITNFDKLAEDLWCKNYNLPISLTHLTNKYKQGTGSKLQIWCQSCFARILVETDKRSNAKQEYYDSNLKLTIAKKVQ